MILCRSFVGSNMKASTWLLLATLALVPYPLSAQTVYAVVWGNPGFVVGSSTLHSGLYRSRDFGASWKHLGPENLKAFSMDAVDSSRGRILYIAAGNGVHRSTDFGATWKIVTDWRISEVLDVRVDQRSPGSITAATSVGAWLSTDGGESWRHPADTTGSLYLYAVERGSTDSSLYLTSDGVIASSNPSSLAWHGPTPRQYLSVAGRGSFLATGRGPQVMSGDSAMHAMFDKGRPRFTCFALASDRDRSLYAAGDSGVWVYRFSPFNNWSNLSSGLPRVPIHALAFLRSRRLLLAGTWGEGVYRRKGSGWTRSGLEGAQVWKMVVKEW